MLQSDELFSFLLGGLTAGMAVGSVPLLIAIKRKRETLGYKLFSACVIASLAYGLLQPFQRRSLESSFC